MYGRCLHIYLASVLLHLGTQLFVSSSQWQQMVKYMCVFDARQKGRCIQGSIWWFLIFYTISRPHTNILVCWWHLPKFIRVRISQCDSVIPVLSISSYFSCLCKMSRKWNNQSQKPESKLNSSCCEPQCHLKKTRLTWSETRCKTVLLPRGGTAFQSQIWLE